EDTVSSRQSNVALHGVHPAQMCELVEQKQHALLRLPMRPRNRQQAARDHEAQPTRVTVQALGRQDEIHGDAISLEGAKVQGPRAKGARYSWAVEEVRVRLRGGDDAAPFALGFLQ